MTKMTRILSLIVLSIIGGLLAAAAFAASIGPDGGLKTLTLPAVAEIAFFFGGITGVLISPLMVWALKVKNLWVAVPSIYGFACSLIIILNLLGVRFPIWIGLGSTAVTLLIYGFFGKRTTSTPLVDDGA